MWPSCPEVIAIPTRVQEIGKAHSSQRSGFLTSRKRFEANPWKPNPWVPKHYRRKTKSSTRWARTGKRFFFAVLFPFLFFLSPSSVRSVPRAGAGGAFFFQVEFMIRDSQESGQTVMVGMGRMAGFADLSPYGKTRYISSSEMPNRIARNSWPNTKPKFPFFTMAHTEKAHIEALSEKHLLFLCCGFFFGGWPVVSWVWARVD